MGIQNTLIGASTAIAMMAQGTSGTSGQSTPDIMQNEAFSQYIISMDKEAGTAVLSSSFLADALREEVGETPEAFGPMGPVLVEYMDQAEFPNLHIDINKIENSGSAQEAMAPFIDQLSAPLKNILLVTTMDVALEQYPLPNNSFENTLGNVFNIERLRSSDPYLQNALEETRETLAEYRADGQITPEELVDFSVKMSSLRGETPYPVDLESMVTYMLDKKGIEATPERVNGVAQDIAAKARLMDMNLDVGFGPSNEAADHMLEHASKIEGGNDYTIGQFIGALAPNQ